ncbi:MAG: galactose oxidase-like domain-containing protein [Candidatus Entotheonellia bacterium]
MFSHNPGDGHMRVTAPPNGNVAPPGYYMLWVVDTAGRPCQVAKFVRLDYQSCTVVTDRSTFSREEVQALGGQRDPHGAYRPGQRQLPAVPPAVPARRAPARFHGKGARGDNPLFAVVVVPDAPAGRQRRALNRHGAARPGP